MGSGDWFKTIISLKHVKGSSASRKSNGLKWKHRSRKQSTNSTFANPRFLGMPVEDVAAIRIQTIFRAYMARKTLRRMKGAVRLQTLTQKCSVQKQATATLNCLHSWTKIQTEIRARRQYMVTEGRSRQKKLENQLKLEAKLHDLEVEWCSGSDTMDEILARIHQREEAAVKRERAMAYAFTHQWRANSTQYLGSFNYELGKANWGWSWMERWIAARPWESRVATLSVSPKEMKSKQANKAGKNSHSPTIKAPVSSKPSLPNGKGTLKARRLSYPSTEKGATATHEGSQKAEESKGSIKTEETKEEQLAS